ITMTGIRPSLFARLPANQAPTAQPISADETANPCRPGPSSNAPASASTAPLMTAVSNPNRNPPSAAAILIPMTRALNRPDVLLLCDMCPPRLLTHSMSGRDGRARGLRSASGSVLFFAELGEDAVQILNG